MTSNPEGISISNDIADLLITDDRWSIEKFKTYYESSTFLSILFIVFTLVLVVRYYLKNNNSS
ncbi:hypothetical protein E6C60_1045 [Paenibacillus algicola]|uniref:Uncharacterized protein n=1 Tax=Paenibacillus algicola TaxID=2565926 RepID=A0A4P8XHU3_9BACL|nr:hypothetical protein E6C60_1045 [Paenibacillus algicola]